MQVQIPIELVPWVRMSPRGLVPRDNMPDEIVPLFKEVKAKIDPLVKSKGISDRTK